MIWSSFSTGGYCVAVARSDYGDITGNWILEDDLLFERDGGHGMIFRTLDGQLMLAAAHTQRQVQGTPEVLPHSRAGRQPLPGNPLIRPPYHKLSGALKYTAGRGKLLPGFLLYMQTGPSASSG